MRIIIKLENNRIKYLQNIDEVSDLSDGFFDATESLKDISPDDYPYVVFENGVAVYKPELKEKEFEEQRMAEEEAKNIPSPQEEIEDLKKENAELKEYVDLISDSVVELAMKTLKE